MYLEIITPDKKVFSGDVDSVTLPGMQGQFQLLKDHAPLVSTLAKGPLHYEMGGKKESILVDGGVLEVAKNKVLVLAEAVVKE
ncbi:MAG: ATP synthase F1 subunit epsilon [Spirosomataceae bacterium]